jgi:hypothetical protein
VHVCHQGPASKVTGRSAGRCGGEISVSEGTRLKTTKAMKTIAKLILIAGLIAGAAVPVIAGPGPEYWQRMKSAEEFAKLRAGDKVLYVCNHCQTVTEKTIASPAEAMEHCKEGAMLTCPSCKEKVRVVVKGPPKNQSVTREVTYVNDKGEACFFVAKQPAKK